MSQPRCIMSLWDGTPNSGTYLGCGVAVGPAEILTARHVLSLVEQNLNNLRAGLSDKYDRGIRVEKIFPHKDRDIALLKLAKRHEKKVIECDCHSPLDAGMKVVCVAYSKQEKCIKGPIDMQITNDTEKNGHCGWEIQPKAAPGMSGGAVILADKLVGIIQACDDQENSTIFIPLEELRGFLEEHGIVIGGESSDATPIANTKSKEFIEYLFEIQKKIEELLSREHLKTTLTIYLQEELNQLSSSLQVKSITCNPADIAKALLYAMQIGGGTCPVVNKVLTNIMVDCLDRKRKASRYKQSLAYRQELVEGIEELLSYLVLSLASEEDARTVTGILGERWPNMYFELHVRTLGGVEIFIAHKGQRRANLIVDGKDISGKYVIPIATHPMSWHNEAQLQEMQLCIWNRVFDEQRDSPLTNNDIDRLRGEIGMLRDLGRDPEFFSVAVRLENDRDHGYQENVANFLATLGIPTICYSVPGPKEPFGGIEYNIMSAIRRFLTTFYTLTSLP